MLSPTPANGSHSPASTSTQMYVQPYTCTIQYTVEQHGGDCALSTDEVSVCSILREVTDSSSAHTHTALPVYYTIAFIYMYTSYTHITIQIHMCVYIPTTVYTM